MKKLITVMLCVLMMMGLAACGNQKTVSSFQDELLTSDKIIIGTSPDYPPFESLDANGNLNGYDIDMLTEVVAILNQQNGTSYTIEWKQMDFNNIITALQASQIDLGVSCFTYDPDRDVIFTTKYLDSKQVIITRADTGITTPADLAGRKVAAGAGTTGAQAAQEAGAELVYSGNYTYMFQALQAGQLDAVVSDEAVGDNYVKTMGLVKVEEALTVEEAEIIIKKGHTYLEEVFNKALETYMASDAYAANKEKWGF